MYLDLLPYEHLHTLLFYSCRVSGHQVPSLAAQPCILLPELKQTMFIDPVKTQGLSSVIEMYLYYIRAIFIVCIETSCYQLTQTAENEYLLLFIVFHFIEGELLLATTNILLGTAE